MRRPPHAGLLLLASALVAGGAALSCEDGEGGGGGGGDAPARQPRARTCFPPEGTDGSPETVEDVVAIVNGLPKPVTVACLLETLDRPLRIEASKDTFSFQPAYGPNNPRIFVFSGGLVLTLVPKGDGSRVVELGVTRGAGRTTKAEIAFPVTEQLSPSMPYDRILDPAGDLTTCAFCHLGEVPDASIDFAAAFVSDLLPPLSHHLVDVEDLRTEFERCDDAADPDRCAVLDAIFAHGEVLHHPFGGG